MSDQTHHQTTHSNDQVVEIYKKILDLSLVDRQRVIEIVLGMADEEDLVDELQSKIKSNGPSL